MFDHGGSVDALQHLARCPLYCKVLPVRCGRHAAGLGRLGPKRIRQHAAKTDRSTRRLESVTIMGRWLKRSDALNVSLELP